MDTQNSEVMVYHRCMIARDLPAVLALEAQSFGGWNEERFRKELRRRTCIGRVVERATDNTIIAFAIYERTEDGIMLVLNMTAATPHAYRSLCQWLVSRAGQDQRKLDWAFSDGDWRVSEI